MEVRCGPEKVYRHRCEPVKAWCYTLPARIDPGVEEVDVYEDLDPIEPLKDELEAVPQSDPDEIEEVPSEDSTPAEYSDTDIWEYDPEEVPAAA
ncbi:hypothetical protein RIF29_29152 [Crotalaria pallida]|uniref:Uncharacterized protein n=1 Tax=Crotalaria pallida TaxID=3830 RepID=A0AAN9EEG1_CROPI